MESIKLPRGEWQYDPTRPLGEAGGFGQVFEGVSSTGIDLAVKRLHLSANEAAHREMRIAEDLADRNLRNVIPVLDSGQDADSDRYFVVMPRAERSLQEDLTKSPEGLPEEDVIEILLSIAKGLSEVKYLVHRDLKPGNILCHGGEWKIADFGIARFVEDSTSLRTLRGCLSPHYAAPEQWVLEKVTGATDVYALGCVAHALLSGVPPFPGPGAADLRDQHLNQPPPSLRSEVAGRVRSIVSFMLRKNAAARPTLPRIIDVLTAAHEEAPGETDDAPRLPLSAVGAEIAEEEARQEAERLSQETRDVARNGLAHDASTLLAELMNECFNRIQNAAPAARRERDRILLGEATFSWSLMPGPIEPGVFTHSGWDVVVGGQVKLHQTRPGGWAGRSASLWYAKRGEFDGYRWLEVSYFGNQGLIRSSEQPFVASPQEADIAASLLTGWLQHAYGPSPMDDENFDDFCRRWMDRFALAAQNNLRPSLLPEV